MDAPAARSKANRPALPAPLARSFARRIAAPQARLARVLEARGDPLRGAAEGPVRSPATTPLAVPQSRRSARESKVGAPTCKAGRGAARRDFAAQARRI